MWCNREEDDAVEELLHKAGSNICELRNEVVDVGRGGHDSLYYTEMSGVSRDCRFIYTGHKVPSVTIWTEIAEGPIVSPALWLWWWDKPV